MNPTVGIADDLLVEQIAHSLATVGEYVCCVDVGPTQHLVDLHWCAHRAGRRIGMKVSVTMAEPVELRRTDHEEQVTMRVAPRRVDARPVLP
ncbi:MAG TPA: hypothetical protein VFE07_11165 [Marmoricola sp.]|jgi:hypothetical protein|nr:hypothetical protein [Marmoricola sp.]